MKFVFILAFLAAFSPVSAGSDNPVQKVLELLSTLQAKIVKEGENAQKVYDEFTEWCEEESKNHQYTVKTAKADAEELKATITKAGATVEENSAKIEELAASTSSDEADLKAATEIRDKEHADFATQEADLMDAIDTLGRAISVLERELQKGAASFTQLQTAGNLAQALKVLVEAAALSNKDASKLTALVQSSQNSDDDAGDMGAPDPTAYKNHSGGIIDVLQDLLDKAETELADARKAEANSAHNYDMLKQSLEDEIKFAGQEMDKAKKAKAEAAETKAVSEGDLANAQKIIDEDSKTLADLHRECMAKSEDFEAATKSRGEELKALAEAKKIISSATGGAEAISYGADEESPSFLQEVSAQFSTRVGLANFEVVTLVRNLAKKEKSAALAQLATRIASAMQYGAASGDDPFAKVKDLISTMIERLLKEGEEEASHKAYCDKEMGETKHKKENLESELNDLTTKIDKMSATSAKLKEQVATLQKELADLAKAVAEMDKIRQEEHDAFLHDKPEMEQGLEGIKMALKILRDYYSKEDKAHDSADGAASGIIGMLEVVESDFSKGLAEMITAEDTAQAEYEKQKRENEISKVMKEQDVKYKTKEFTGLDKTIAETTSDAEGVKAELDAVLEYYDRLKPMCIAQPESYEERAKRREAEIAGLKEALSILAGESVLLQRDLRASHRATAPPAQSAKIIAANVTEGRSGSATVTPEEAAKRPAGECACVKRHGKQICHCTKHSKKSNSTVVATTPAKAVKSNKAAVAATTTTTTTTSKKAPTTTTTNTPKKPKVTASTTTTTKTTTTTTTMRKSTTTKAATTTTSKAKKADATTTTTTTSTRTTTTAATTTTTTTTTRRTTTTKAATTTTTTKAKKAKVTTTTTTTRAKVVRTTTTTTMANTAPRVHTRATAKSRNAAADARHEYHKAAEKLAHRQDIPEVIHPNAKSPNGKQELRFTIEAFRSDAHLPPAQAAKSRSALRGKRESNNLLKEVKEYEHERPMYSPVE